MNYLEKLLLKVAEEQAGMYGVEGRLDVLRRKLLPLLEAGEAMADGLGEIEGDHHLAESATYFSKSWHAALKAALEGGEMKGERG